MKALLLRNRLVVAQSHGIPASDGVSRARQNSLHGVSSGQGASVSPKVTLRLEVNRWTGGIRRSLSETDATKPAGSSNNAGSMPMVGEEMHVDLWKERTFLSLNRNLGDEIWTRSEILVDEVGCDGGEIGKGNDSGSDRVSGGGFGRSRKNVDDHYQELLKSNPSNPLLLRNYGKYLHEVEGDFKRAEEYYSRAILVCPADGDVLSLYGTLIWETQRDGQRAKSYFDQAVRASPDDCTVLGSYAHFMWEMDEEEEEGE
ncbi:hypothetical protein SAY86_011304 [Trapa natans]|uniref:TmcB/TmcC TPR repeats domain-containing protein n=1 Tax=Trapa natans TaxID=22666 RepID=A0AAN7R514_TRANT|nr:hypothetical protein SAY86_011304 [Trapa natans]